MGGDNPGMYESLLFSLQSYLLTFVMTPFGLVFIPQGMSTLFQHTSLALIFYGYLLINPLFYRFFLNWLKKRELRQRATSAIHRKHWIWAGGWALFSHFWLFQILHAYLYSGKEGEVALTPSMELVGLSAIALFVVVGSTAFLSYKYRVLGKEGRYDSLSSLFRK